MCAAATRYAPSSPVTQHASRCRARLGTPPAPRIPVACPPPSLISDLSDRAAVTGAVYLTLKLVHIVAASVYLSMFVLGPIVKIASDRARDPAISAFIQDRLWRTSPWVVGISGFIVFSTGYAMVRGFLGKIAGNPFSLWGLIVLFVSLAVWYFAMRPLEAKMANMADENKDTGVGLGDDYRTASGSWLLANGVMVVLVLVANWLMVFKPTG